MVTVDVTVFPALLVLRHVDGNVDFFHDGHMDFLVDRDMFNDRNMLVDRDVFDVMMVDGVHFVRNMNNYVLAGII